MKNYKRTIDSMERRSIFKKYRLHIIFSIAGAIVGYLVFHPYTMLVSSIMYQHPEGEIHWHWKNLFDIIHKTFEPLMLPMAIAFMLFGGVIGLLIGIAMDRKNKLYAIELENERKKVALETLNRLIVTLSHYLLNANMIIGGKVRYSQKVESNKDILNSLKVIGEQAKKIDSVIRALRKVTKIKTADYTTEGRGLMIDITKEMEEELNKSKGEKE